jgi:ribosomal protein S27E
MRFLPRNTEARSGLIEVACVCGQTVRTHNEAAGKRVRCPGCGNLVNVPIPSLAAMAGEAAPAPPPTSKPAAPPVQRVVITGVEMPLDDMISLIFKIGIASSRVAGIAAVAAAAIVGAIALLMGKV